MGTMNNGTKRDRMRLAGHAARVVAAMPVTRDAFAFVEVARRGGLVEVTPATFARYRRRFPATAYRVECFTDVGGRSFETIDDSRLDAIKVRELGKAG
jgi:hypothetical protein